MLKILRALIITVLVALIGVIALGYYMAGPAMGPDIIPQTGLLNFPIREHSFATISPSSIRVVTYNIGYASAEKNNLGAILSRDEVVTNLDQMIESLTELKPDILCLQEVDFYASRSFDINQMEYLATRLKMPYVAYAINWNIRYLPWPYWPPSKHFGRIVSGQAILSRYPLANHEALYFEKPQSRSFIYNLGYIDRVAQHVSVQVGTSNIDLWNVHLEAFDPMARLEQVRKLSEQVLADKDEIILVAGDFNSISYRRSAPKNMGKSIREFIQQTQLINAEPELPLYSFPSWNPNRKIDHIFYQGLRAVEKGNITQLKSSDHLPVWAEFELE